MTEANKIKSEEIQVKDKSMFIALLVSFFILGLWICEVNLSITLRQRKDRLNNNDFENDKKYFLMKGKYDKT